MYKIGRLAQLVERWSNKPLVMGSSPIVTICFLQKKHDFQLTSAAVVFTCASRFYEERHEVCFRSRAEAKEKPVPGLEPGISCSVGRRLVHWAIRAT